MKPEAVLGVLLALAGMTLAAAAWTSLDPVALSRWLNTPDPPLVLDARGPSAYRSGTLPEALDAGSDPAGFLADGRGGAVVLILPQPPDAGRLGAWVERLRDFRHQVYLLAGGVPAWRAAGLEVIAPGERFVRPGTVPFVIPKGLCEGDEPAQEFR